MARKHSNEHDVEHDYVENATIRRVQAGDLNAHSLSKIILWRQKELVYTVTKCAFRIYTLYSIQDPGHTHTLQ